MTTVADAVAATGIVAPDKTDLILVKPVDGRFAHITLAEAADSDLGNDRIAENLYLASGAFTPGTVSKYAGRKGENVASVLSLLFDCDLIGYMGLGDSDEARAYVYGMTQDELDPLSAEQSRIVHETFAQAGISLSRLDYTGHGVCGYLYLRDATADDTVAISRAYKEIIRKVNAIAGFALVDPQRSDAGSGISRLPGSLNTKGVVPRRVRTIDNGWVIGRRLTPAQVCALVDQQPLAAPRAPFIPSPSALDDDVMEQVVAAIRPYWSDGQRHALALGFFGLLAKNGIPEEQAEAVMGMLAGSDPDPWDRIKVIRTTYERARTGQDVRGYFALRDCLPPDTLAFIDGKLNSYHEASTAPRLITSRTPKVEEHTTALAWSPVPADAFHGWFGDYRDLMSPTTEASDTFHLAASLTVAGALVGRRLFTRYAGTTVYPNCFHVLIGESGVSRKDTAINRALSLPSYATANTLQTVPYDVVRSLATGEVLVDTFNDLNKNLLWYITEMTTLLRAMQKEATRSIGDKIIEAWDTGPSIETRSRTKGPVVATGHYLSILAAIQPGRLEDNMHEMDIISGFANRWGYFPGQPKPRKAMPPDVDHAVANALYQHLRDAILFYPEGTQLRLSPTARDRMIDWYMTRPDEEDEFRQTMRVRHDLLIHKYALLYAITDTANDIRDEHLAAAMTLVEWMWGEVQRMLPTWGASRDGRLEQRIMTVLKKYGPQSRREVQGRCKSTKWSPVEFGRMFEAMEKNGTIESGSDDSGRIVYRAAWERE